MTAIVVDPALANSSSLPWVEKFRPKELKDLVSHEDIISTIKRFMDQQKLPHMLFYGPAGTGLISVKARKDFNISCLCETSLWT